MAAHCRSDKKTAMIDPYRIVQTEARTTAVIPLVIPRIEIRQHMAPAIAELMATLAAQGIAPAGPLFTRHFRFSPDLFDFEVGVPVDAQVAASGRVSAGQLPASRVARTVYRGPYEGLADAWGEFKARIAADSQPEAGGLWECYVVGPETSPDPTRWQTELNCPLR
jgi:effector-binding domain-containing protein